MATSIHLSADNHLQPECDQAHNCHWFVKTGTASNSCANRKDTVCLKHLADIFEPHGPKRVEVEQ